MDASYRLLDVFTIDPVTVIEPLTGAAADQALLVRLHFIASTNLLLRHSTNTALPVKRHSMLGTPNWPRDT